MSASVADNASERDMIEFSEDEHLSFFYNIEQIYTELPGVISNYGTFAQSLQICRQLSNQIIRNSIAEAQERFILRNIPLNAINEFCAQTNLILNSKLNDGGVEVETCVLEEDQEPEPIFSDRWRRNRILMMAEMETKVDIDDKLNNDNNKIVSKSRLYDIRKNTVRLPTTPPPPNQFEAKLIQIYQEEFEDEFEDKLRNAKLYEMKKKNEIEQKKKEDKLQSQIEKKDGGTQKYTYDFDGKIILGRAIKMDKLQPTNQKLKVEFKEQIKQDQQPNIKKGGKRDSTKVMKPQCPEQEIPNRVIQERKDAAKEVMGDKALRMDKTSQFPYEVFTMNNGVKLYFEHKMKEGVRHQISDSAENLQIKLSASNLLTSDDASQFASQIRLTKAEYQLITDAQTLQQTRQQFMPSENINIPDHDQQVTQQSILLKNKKTTSNNNDNNLAESKQVQFNAGISQLNPFKRVSPIPQQAQTERIQLKNVKMIENLLVTGVPDTPKSSKPEQPPLSLPDNISTNPIDLFNQQLLTQKEWGKQSGGKTSYFPPVKQQKRVLETKAYKGSLEQMYKMPRERLVAQTGRTAMNFYNQNSDGTKKVAKSVSDGFMQTFYTTHTKFSEKLRQ
ncbi:unnamed protein product [Paramecium sonneborni]|uniref:Uncharacterized protein n=1 Tax=Paramecium sonneborni TaxID=65129 RepID=A0A8S1MDA7_9CILI|nr:unnamed protein product [Paramecium sonneborni]